MPFYLQMSKNLTQQRDIQDSRFSYISILTNLQRTDLRRFVRIEM